MKRLFIGVLFALVAVNSTAQYPYDNKRDNLWPFGYGWHAGLQDTLFGLTWLNYNTGLLSSNRQSVDIDFNSCSCVGCDTNGNVLFTTNGIFVFDSTSNIMLGCDTLNPGVWAHDWESEGYPLPQGALALPAAGNNQLWYLFHGRISDISTPGTGASDMRDVFYTIIDMTQNSGKGKVVSLRNPILQNEILDYGKLTACRHANGRDWWVLFFNNLLTKYHRILLDLNGVNDLGWTNLATMGIPFTGLGQSQFSQDGTKYMTYSGISKQSGEFLEIFDFDRCTGSLTSQREIHTFDSCFASGLAISPNSRFVYTSCGASVNQYDMEALDIEASKTTVAIWDGFVDPEFPVGTLFFLMGNTPDGKIIVNSCNSVRFLHLINTPDSPGLSCNVLQHSLPLYTFNALSMPNYPNFRLGPVDGSACDTLGIDVGIAEPPKQAYNPQAALEVYPNPAGNYCNIGFGSTLKQDGILIVHDLNGRTMFETPLQKATIGYTLKTEGWPATLYLCTVYEGSKSKGSIRFVKE